MGIPGLRASRDSCARTLRNGVHFIRLRRCPSAICLSPQRCAVDSLRMSLAEDGGAGTVVDFEWRGRPAHAWKPAKLSDRAFDLTEAQVRATERASAAVRTVDRSMPGASEPLLRLLVRHEGVASSEIEGLRQPLVSVLTAERTDAGGDAGWVADNLDVIEAAFESAHRPLTVEMLHDWHRRLMRHSGLASELIGVWRPRVGWVGGTSPLDAAYVPPPPDEIPELMDDLIRVANDGGGGLDPISHAGILHAQFEAIHPYADGNGRIGRALISRQLRRADLTRRSTVPMSVVIRRGIGGYLSGLHHFQRGDSGDWVGWFAETAIDAAAVTDHLIETAHRVTEAWADRLSGLRVDSAARALAPLLIGCPVLSAVDAADLLGVSTVAARNALRSLADRGIVEPVPARTPGVGRNRDWFAAADVISIRLH